MNLFRASRQWRERPKDERFPSVQALHDACVEHRLRANEVGVTYGELHAVPLADEVALIGSAGNPVLLTHWAFGQLCQRAEAPASYLRDLPAELAAVNLEHGLRKRAQSEAVNLLFHRMNGAGQSPTRVLRAFTSEAYTRIWNADVTSRLVRLVEQGPWQAAPPGFDGSRGLYASAHDMFAFMVDNNRRIFERGPAGGLSRGFFVWNSEVGAASFGVCRFLYEYVCGNHIVWGARDVAEIRIRHVGRADERAFRELRGQLMQYADASASEDEAIILRAMTRDLGKDKEAVLDRIFGLRIPELSRKRTEQAFDIAVQHDDWYGSPRTVWGMVNGISHLAREIPYADERTALDRAAGKVLSMVF